MLERQLWDFDNETDEIILEGDCCGIETSKTTIDTRRTRICAKNGGPFYKC